MLYVLKHKKNGRYYTGYFKDGFGLENMKDGIDFSAVKDAMLLDRAKIFRSRLELDLETQVINALKNYQITKVSIQETK